MKVWIAIRISARGTEGVARIPVGRLEAVIEAAGECPGECTSIEVG